MKRLRLALLLMPWLACLGAANGEETPWLAGARTVEALVLPGYQALQQATGDLAGDGRDDAAVVIGKQSESASSETPRWLLIARRGPDGLLRPWVASRDVVWCKGCGGVYGDPLAAITIKGHGLQIEHYGGSNWRWHVTDDFRWLGNEWLHTATSNTQTMVLDTSFSHARSANLLSGLVVVKREGTEIAGRLVYHELRAALSDTAFGPPLHLGSAQDVVVGRETWQGPSDLSATFQARVSGGILTLQGDLTDQLVTPGDTVRLLDRHNRPLKPQSASKTLQAGGYRWLARYELKDLERTDAAEPVEGSPPDAMPIALPVFEASLEVVDDDGPNRLLKVLSSSQGGRRYPGSLRLQAHPGLPKLVDFNHSEDAGDDRIDEIAH
jgi:hypothetical protein